MGNSTNHILSCRNHTLPEPVSGDLFRRLTGRQRNSMERPVRYWPSINIKQMSLRSELLGKVEYSNLLQINWNEQRIEHNFRLIVEALQSQQADNASLREGLAQLKEEIATVSNKVDSTRQAPSGAGQDGGGTDGIGLSELRNEFQKKLSEVGNRLNGDLAGLKAETDALRRQLEEGLAHRENRPASGTRLPTHQSRKSIDDDLRAKLAALNEQVEKLKSDLLALNAKVNVQQQMANRRDSVKVKSKAALGEDLVEGKDAVGEGASFDAGQIGNILIDMGTLRLCYEELKLVQAEMKKTEDKRAAKVDHLHEKLDALRHGMEHERDRVDREFKNIKIAIASLPGLPTTSTSTNSTNQNSNSTQNPVPTPTNSTPSPNANPNANGNGNSPSTPNPTSASNQSSASQRRDSENKSDHINDRISKLHQLMLESANQTDIERLREEFDEKIKEVTRALEKGLPPLQDGLAEVKARLDGLQDRIDKEMAAIHEDIAKNAQQQLEKSANNEKRHNSTASKLQDIRKDLQYLKQDLDYYKTTLLKSQSLHNSGSTPSPNSSDDPQTSSSGQSSSDLRKKLQDLKRQQANKLHDLRSELINAIRDFERRMSSKNNCDQQIGQLHEKFEQIKLYLSRKADVEDTKKSLVYLDKKLSLVLNSLNREDENVEDARLAKKNWFCLSCDKVLEGYSGKVGKHIPWDALSPKNVLKITQMGNTSKIEAGKRKDPLPTLNTAKKV